MQQEFISSFNQFGKNMVNSAKEFAEINGRFAGKVLESQIGLAKVFVETSEKQVDAAESINSPAEYVNKQTTLVGELSEKISDATKNSVKIAEETNLELKSWFEKGVKAADNAVKETKETVVAATVATSPVTAKAVATKSPATRKTSAAKKTAVKTSAKTAVKVKAKAPAKSKTTAKPVATKAPAKKTPVKKASPAVKKPAAAKKTAKAEAQVKKTTADK